MDSRPTYTQTLNYFQQSPIRGQLEPPDGTTGDRRYLQCTDTPNELKVLLPSRTTAFYAKLLATELAELKRGSAASWERIREVRRLKERMIRKCERLARASAGDRPPGQICTLYAPPDFRLREMEKWVKHQHENATGGQIAKSYSCCNKCGPLGTASPLPAAPAPAPVTMPTPSPPSEKQTKRASTAIATRTFVAGQENTQPSRSNSMRNVRPGPPKGATVTRSSSTRTAAAATPTGKSEVTEKVPKRPSPSRTQGTGDSESYQHYHVARHGSKQQVSRVIAYARPGAKASATATATTIQVPAVIRQADPPPKMIPPPAVEREMMIAAAAAAATMSGTRTPPSHISRVIGEEAARNMMQSPDPLPIPYRPRQPHHSQQHQHHEDRYHERGRDEHAARSRTASPPGSNASMHSQSPRAPHDELAKVPSPQSTLVDAPQTAGAPATRRDVSPPSSGSGKGAPTKGQPLETIQEGPGEREAEEATARHPLLRRRSSLKKKTSIHSLASQAKSVTWAMDRDWSEKAEKFVRVSNEAELVGYELEQSRTQYQEEIAMMRVVCQDVVRAAEKLGLATDELKHEGAALAVQQHKVATVTEAMEQREARYKDAVLAVLEETKQIVQLCDKKRDFRDD